MTRIVGMKCATDGDGYFWGLLTKDGKLIRVWGLKGWPDCPHPPGIEAAFFALWSSRQQAREVARWISIRKGYSRPRPRPVKVLVDVYHDESPQD